MAKSKRDDLAARIATPKSNRLTPTQWGEAEALWASGEFTLKQLAERFGVRHETLSRRFTKRGVVKGSKDVATAVRDSIAEAGANDGAELLIKIRETKEEHYKWAQMLARLGMAELAAARNKGNPMATAMANLKAIKVAIEICKIAREERWTLLGLDKDVGLDEELPELIIRGLTAEEIARLHVIQNDDELAEHLQNYSDDKLAEDLDDLSESDLDGADISG
tara:strand:+ start:5832 stop:6497 length:666 start_codon:yes stop_codon:yes gene_type:complete